MKHKHKNTRQTKNREDVERHNGKSTAPYHRPLLFGPSVLYLAGMTTQIPAQPCIVMPGEGAPKHIDGNYVFFRPPSWFDSVQGEIFASGKGVLAEMGSYGFDYLSPRMSLIESWVSSDCWQPQSDDLDLDEDEISGILQLANDFGEPYCSAAILIFNKAANFKSPRI